MEYASEIILWESNKASMNVLESVIFRGAKKMLGCSSKKAVRGDMCLETLKGCRDRWNGGVNQCKCLIVDMLNSFLVRNGI